MTNDALITQLEDASCTLLNQGSSQLSASVDFAIGRIRDQARLIAAKDEALRNIAEMVCSLGLLNLTNHARTAHALTLENLPEEENGFTYEEMKEDERLERESEGKSRRTL